MAGLLDFLQTDEGRMGLGLLAAAGPRSDGAGFGQRMQEAMQGQDAYKQRQLALQMQMIAEKRAQQAFDMQRDAYNSVGGQSQQAGPQQAPQMAPQGQPSGPGYAMGGQQAPQQAPGGDANAELLRLQKMAIAGVPGAKELFDIYKYKNTPQQFAAGGYMRDPVSGQTTYMGDPTKGLTLGPNGAVQRMQGSENIAGLAGDTAAAQERAKAGFDLVPVPRGDGSTQMMPRAQAVNALGNAPDVPGRGLDLSKLSADQMRQLSQADPQAFAAGVQRFNQSNPLLGVTPSATDTDVRKAQLLDPVNATAEFNKGRAGNMNRYEESLNGRVSQGADLNMRLQEAAKAMQTFQSGGGMETRADLASKAQAIGLPDSVVNKIAGGDLAAAQEFNKLAAQQAMEQLKQAMGGAGRISQYEFKVFQQNNPNLSTDPNAVRKIYDFNTRVYNRDLTEQKAFNDHVDSGANPASFPMMWQSQQAKLGYTNPKMDATTASQPKTAPPIPMKGMIRNGFRFKGGNPGDQNNWEPQ